MACRGVCHNLRRGVDARFPQKGRLPLRKSVLALALVALLPGCSDEESNPVSGTTPSPSPSPSPTAEPTIAAITVTVNPVLSPAIATGDPNFPWAVTWQTTVRETAGIGATVTAIDVHFVTLVATYIGGDLNAASTNGSVNLAARGSLTFNQGFSYTSLDGNLAVISIVVWVRDARGNVISQVAQLRIV